MKYNESKHVLKYLFNCKWKAASAVVQKLNWNSNNMEVHYLPPVAEKDAVLWP